MAQEKEQLPLNLKRTRITLVRQRFAVRKRLALLEEEGDEEVRLRVPTAVAQAVHADPAAAVRAMARKAEEELAAITAGNVAVTQRSVDGTMLPGIAQGPGFLVNEDVALYTSWESKERPTWVGFYDVTDHESGTLNTRWWWGAESWLKGDPQAAAMTRSRLAEITHEDFVKNYAWRGLKERPRDAYPLPPYVLEDLPPGAPVDGKYVKRT